MLGTACLDALLIDCTVVSISLSRSREGGGAHPVQPWEQQASDTVTSTGPRTTFKSNLIMSYRVLLYCIVSHRIVSYSIVLYCVVLYCIASYSISSLLQPEIIVKTPTYGPNSNGSNCVLKAGENAPAHHRPAYFEGRSLAEYPGVTSFYGYPQP